MTYQDFLSEVQDKIVSWRMEFWTTQQNDRDAVDKKEFSYTVMDFLYNNDYLEKYQEFCDKLETDEEMEKFILNIFDLLDKLYLLREQDYGHYDNSIQELNYYNLIDSRHKDTSDEDWALIQEAFNAEGEPEELLNRMALRLIKRLRARKND